MRKGNRIFYGWFVVLAGILITAGGIGVYNSASSVCVKPICESLSLSRAEFTMHRTIITLVGAFLFPFYGKLIRKHGVRKPMTVSAVSLGLVTIAYSFAQELWHFYVIAAINGAFINGVNFMIVGTLISEWFEDKKGLASGLAYCGSGLGSAIMVPIVSMIVENMDWRWAYRGIGVLGMIILIPTILFFVKERPEVMGLQPYTSKNRPAEEGASEPQGMMLRQAAGTPAFWMMMVSFFLIGFLAAGPYTHTIPYLDDLGYSAAFSASVISLIMVFQMTGKIVLGSVYDRFGTMVGNVFVGICLTAFPVLALAASNPVIPWVYGALYGMASAGVSVPVTILITRYFGTRDLPVMFSLCSMISTLGQSIAVPAMGAVYDIFGSYRAAWVALAVFAALVLAGLIGATVSGRKLALKR